MRVQVKIREAYNLDLAIAEMFEFPTIRALAQRLSRQETAFAEPPPAPVLTPSVPEIAEPVAPLAAQAQPEPQISVSTPTREPYRVDSQAIAIIGMAGRFPGANTVDEFWRNLVTGVDSTSFFTDEELAASGLNVAEIRANRNYVAARGVIDKADWFDAGFFSIGAKEAEVMDPQQRVFLETAWGSA